MKNSLTSLEPRSERSSPCCIVSESRFWWDVVFDRWSIHKNIRFHRKASFPSDKTAGVSSRTFTVKKYPILWRTLWPLHALALLHWLLWLSWDCTISSRYPFQHHSSPFLLIICIDAPESTTNSRFWGLRVFAGRHLFSEGEKNVALFFSFNLKTLLASLHAASRAPCSCHSVSS